MWNAIYEVFCKIWINIEAIFIQIYEAIAGKINKKEIDPKN